MPNNRGAPMVNYRETKNKKDMPLDLKAFPTIRKQLKLKQGILYWKYQVSNNSRARLQFVLPIEYRHKAIAGYHDQIVHLERIVCWNC